MAAVILGDRTAGSDDTARRIVCGRCGAPFECRRDGDCWCMREPVRLTLSDIDRMSDCLCPDCLRGHAEPGGPAQ